MTDPSGVLDGIRVADFTHVVAGPFCTRMLADHGADVIKVEPFAGDLMRQLPVRVAGDLSSAFTQYNCGKRSIAIDLKSPDGRSVAQQICRHADVVVENFSLGKFSEVVGTPDELDPNGRTIFCSVSTFGS